MTMSLLTLLRARMWATGAAIFALAATAMVGSAGSASATGGLFWTGGGCRAAGQYGPDATGAYLDPCASYRSDNNTTWANVYFRGNADDVVVQIEEVNSNGTVSPLGYRWDLGACHGTCDPRSPSVNGWNLPDDSPVVYVESYWLNGVFHDAVDSSWITAHYPL